VTLNFLHVAFVIAMLTAITAILVSALSDTFAAMTLSPVERVSFFPYFGVFPPYFFFLMKKIVPTG
jgi:hypothetical protein